MPFDLTPELMDWIGRGKRAGPMVPVVTGDGDPYWKGRPSRDRVFRIFMLTRVVNGRMEYCTSPGKAWRRLRDAADYAELNAALDRL